MTPSCDFLAKLTDPIEMKKTTVSRDGVTIFGDTVNLGAHRRSTLGGGKKSLVY